MADVKLGLLYGNIWNHFTAWKKWAQTRLKNVTNKMFLQIVYLIYMYKIIRHLLVVYYHIQDTRWENLSPL